MTDPPGPAPESTRDGPKITTGDDNPYFSRGDAAGSGAALDASSVEHTAPVTPTTERPPERPQHDRAAQEARVPPPGRQQSAIRLRRLRAPSVSSALPPVRTTERGPLEGQRRRSSSEPQRPTFPTAAAYTALPTLAEGNSNPSTQRRAVLQVPPPAPASGRASGRAFSAVPGAVSRQRGQTVQGHPLNQVQDRDCYDSRIVDFLDVVDPEVATLTSVTNIQNSLFVPSLGRWINRRPTYDLPQLPAMPGAFPPSKEDVAAAERGEAGQPPAAARSPSLSSVLSEPQYAILPENTSLEGWSEEDIKLLNDYVRHMLHSRRSKIKQRFKAFGKYASKPLGFLVTLYATLITLFGLAWVLFLIGWIYVGDKQLYVINVIDYVLVALFAIVGDGLAPFRAIDTYHMVFVAHYHRKTWKLRKKLLLPDLRDHNDLPTGRNSVEPDLEARNPQPQQKQEQQEQEQEEKDEFFPVLSEKEQARLVHHQTKLANSHTFYKPHETETHHAFPLRLLIAVVLLLDLHSCLQISLGVCTWGIPYERRPTAVTTTILCCSIAANITAGVLISIGDRRTRKKDVLDRLLKQDLTGEVMKKMRKKREKAAQKEEANAAAVKREDSEDGAGGEKPGRISLSLPRAWVGGERKSSEKDRGGSKESASAEDLRGGINEKDHVEDGQENKGGLQIPGGLPRIEGKT
ncbi:hypothetical protein C8A03DRAFT_48312 [Achaetomium macrosporum]|uniref:Integral membrane protein n=1 Tax=Achaetomium macrosporum TaxID=79813 RepID=A0AAN7H643_9PEZI|nr:hypothetical protein C8A03DRAFT_48312 [Achaetomium macrosporum]